MPPVHVNPVDALNLFEDAQKCMARISEKVGKEEQPAGNGYVVYCNEDFTVVTAHPSYEFQSLRNGKIIHGQVPIVTFCDGARATDTMFIKMHHYVNLILARIPHGDWEVAQPGKLSYHSRDILLSVTSLYNKMVPFIGRVISPRATAVDRKGEEIPSSTNTFTFDLPMAGGTREEEKVGFEDEFKLLKNQVLGSPVFNLRRKMVGFVDRCGIKFQVKFGRRSEELESVIHGWLAGRDWEKAIADLTSSEFSAGGSKRAKRI